MSAPEHGESGEELRRTLGEELEEIRDRLRRLYPDLDVELLPIFGRVGALAGLLRGFYARLLANSGLTHPEHHALGIIRGTGPRPPTDRWRRAVAGRLQRPVGWRTRLSLQFPVAGETSAVESGSSQDGRPRLVSSG